MPVELSSSRPPAPEATGLTGRHVLFALLAFFGIIFAVNFTMMTLAIRTMPGVNAKSAYEASQHFNRALDTIAAQDRLGWQVDIATTGIRSGAPLNVHVRDRSGEALLGLAVRARIERPTDARFDRALTLTEVGDGRYAGPLPTLAPGQWTLIVEILRGSAQQFVSERRIILRD
jgi:nitrogen fixation protein FixH